MDETPKYVVPVHKLGALSIRQETRGDDVVFSATANYKSDGFMVLDRAAVERLISRLGKRAR